jgi:CBS domain-containing protein
MFLNDPFLFAPILNDAIDRNPLIATPETLITEAIASMSQTQGRSCSLSPDTMTAPEISQIVARASYVLVMRDSQLLGIFTERDIVRLTATGKSFVGVTLAEVMIQPVITLQEKNFQDIFAALFLFRRYRIRHLPIVSDEGELVGLVSPETIRQVLRPANLLKLRRVADIMTRHLIHTSRNASVLSLAQLMAARRVSCVVIADQDSDDRLEPIGIVTERDIVQFKALEINLAKISAQEIMSAPLFLLSPEDSLWMAHQEMQRRHVRRLVVSWNWGRDLGIITQTSLLRIFDPMEMYSVIETLQRTVQQLETEKAQLLQKYQEKWLDFS